MTTALQNDITNAIIDEIAAQFYTGGVSWTIKREDAAGTLQTIATATPLYILQEQPSEIVKALSQSAATLRTQWKMYARTSAAASVAVNDVLINTVDTSLSFLVTGIDAYDLPGAFVFTLEKRPYV